MPVGDLLRAFLVLLLAPVALRAQNSTEKIRAEPSPVASRCGEAVHWCESLEAALKQASEQHRDVFWYVPTLRGSPMDRKPEIDRYMLAGPFSWTATVRVLNERFVPVRGVPSREQAKQFRLERVSFIEPGFLVLRADGSERARVDEITTYAPSWFLDRLAEVLDPKDEVLAAARADVLRLEHDTEHRRGGMEGPRAEVDFVRGALRFWDGDEKAAHEIWNKLVADSPDDPWAWKAAAEVEGHGPLVNGFEVPWRPLAPGVAGVPTPRGTMAPAGAFDLPALRVAAIRYFASQQRSDGGFTDSRYDFGGTDALPNVWTADTALAALAVLEIAPHLESTERMRGEAVLQKALDYVQDDAHIAKDDRDEIVWAHLYRARLASRWLQLRPDDRPRVLPLLQRAVADLIALQPQNGAWFHEYANPFVIGACLVALDEARSVGVKVPDEPIDRGVLALLRCRTKDGAVSYGYSERGEARAQPQGGAGRMPLAELALLRCGQGNGEALQKAIAASFQWHEELAKVRKYDDHASRFGYGGFFFWFDVHARTEAILRMEPGAQRDAWIKEQREQILALPEFDGCFVDSHELGRVYGTAMAQICLALLDR